MLSIYIHIPFCIRKCSYCDFNSFEAPISALADYADLLCAELDLRAKTFQPAEISTLYFGGGTPSLLPPALVSYLIAAVDRTFPLQKNAEITLEANPGTVTAASLEGYLAGGVNRLSLGVQSLDDRQLALLGRIHSADDAGKAIEMAKAAGFQNIGIDLIHGLPGQSLDEWQAVLEESIAMNPQHISAYGLSIEAGTPLALQIGRGELFLPDEELSAQMFEMTAAILGNAGYEQYEISNFSLPGFSSRHNRTYWERTSYLGLGAGAHSFSRPDGFGCRWENPSPLDEYGAAVRNGTLPEVLHLSEREAMSEFMFLGLRRLEGVDRDDFAQQFGMSLENAFPGRVESSCAKGLLHAEGNRLRLSGQGLLLANMVMGEFV